MAYGLLLWVQTLSALSGLGLAGGWVLLPFRDAHRPYLWLAAPLAGIPALGGALYVLYYGCGLPLGPALALGWLALAGVTLVCLFRGGVSPLRPGGLAALAVVAASVWGTYYTNYTAIRAGAPTMAEAEGSDQFGYSMGADWLAAHPASRPPRGDDPFQVVACANLCHEGSRPVAFLWAAAAAWLRGTTALFAYDWWCGVALAAALLGLAGLFAAEPVGLILLLLTAASCSWAASSRTGFLGKTLAYPGGLLLAFLYLQTWSRFSLRRAVAVCLLGPPVAFCVNALFPVLLLGVLLAALLFLLLVGWLAGGATPGFLAELRPGWGAVLRAVGLYAAATLPAFLFQNLLFKPLQPVYVGMSWDFIVPVALDLENPGLPLVGARLCLWLVLGFALCQLLLLLAAVRHGSGTSLVYLLSFGLVPLAWLLGQPKLYAFYGLLYPLTMVGAVLLLSRPGRRWLPGVAAVAAAVVALHLPQAYLSGVHYLHRKNGVPVVVRRSEVEAMRQIIGTQTVDVCLGECCDGCVVLTELGCHGTRLQLHEPAWGRTVAAWFGCATGVMRGAPPSPKGHFSIVERDAYAPPGTERYRGSRLKLCEDGDAVTFREVKASQGLLSLVWDEQRRPGFWQGHAPSSIEICNGTGRAAAVRFRAEGRPVGFANPDVRSRTVHYRFGGEEHVQVLSPSSGWQIDLPLEVPPGSHCLELWVSDPVTVPPAPGQPEMLLWVTNLGLCPAPAATVAALPTGR
jgi:hypothetical protein